MPKIILMRHAQVHMQNETIYASEMKHFIEAYNSAEVENNKPEGLPKADIYLCSELKRSQDSLALLGYKPDLIDNSFNEAELPYANWRGLKIPAKIWAIVFRIAWLFGYSHHSESYKEAKERAKAATDKLLNFANRKKDVMLLGHGVMNRIIIKELVHRGYRVVEKTGSGNWGYSVMESKE